MRTRKSPADGAFWLAPRLVRARFSRASQQYDAASAIVTELRQRLLERLELVRLAPQRVLDLGAGTGMGTRALKQRYPKAHVVALDSSSGMSRQASTQRGWLRRFEVCMADAASLPFAAEHFDLVFSHLMLPWCNSPDAVFEEVARVLRPGGLFLFSSLGPDTAIELRRLWHELDDDVHVHAFMDMHDVGDGLVRQRFADPVMDLERLTVTYANLDDLLREARQLGVTNLAAGRRRGLGSKRNLHALRAGYAALARADARLPVTLEVVYGHAWISEQSHVKAHSGGEIRIPVGQISRRSRD